MSATKVAVLGANGQVGSETCLFLRLQHQIEVVPISRSVAGSALLRRCGFSCRHGAISSTADAQQLLGDCAAVVDFSLPKGRTGQVRQTMRTIIESCMAEGTDIKNYIYMSTVSVYRLARHEPIIRTYQLVKRYAETRAKKAAARHAKHLWVFRLGQVHGELQAVSRNLRRTIRDGDVTVPVGPSNTIFVFSIAEAIVSALNRVDPPGVYAAVSSPPWTWRDIHEYYAHTANVTCTIKERPLLSGRFDHAVLRGIGSFVTRELRTAAFRNRDIVDNLLGYVSDSSQVWLRAKHARNRVARAVSETSERRPWAPYPMERVVPGRRLTLSDSRSSMHDAVAHVRRELSRLTS